MLSGDGLRVPSLHLRPREYSQPPFKAPSLPPAPLRYLYKKEFCPWDGSALNWFQRVVFLGIRDFTRYWHGYEMHGLENVSEHTLLVGYHSRCTIDLVYLLATLQPSVVVSYLMFKIPVLRTAIHHMNLMPSKAADLDGAEMGFTKALLGPRPVLILPGGAHECLKPYAQMGQLQWKEVPGFARMLKEDPLLHGVKV
ncbi:hypothetical protein B484DRAFT_406657 [Ochromonadaceae sp. CCMP2298]|nr:hypothetical protein B484DRAFT_406657 [Ochromonadaceae sp. CCMP2298]